MKKYLSIILTFIFILAPLSFAKAQDTNSAPATFFESMDNLQKLNSYVMNQSLSGDFKINLDQAEDIQTLKGNYKIDLNTRSYNKNPYENDFDSDFKGHIKLSAIGEKKPFSDLSIYFRAEMISLFGDGVYIRLISATLLANGVPEKDMQAYQDFLKEFNTEISSVRGKWIYFPSAYYTNELKEEAPEGVGELLDSNAIADKFKKDGIKKTYEGLIQDALKSLETDGTLTEEEKKSITKISNEFFNTKFFSLKTLTSGPNKGLTSFYLIKPKILKFASKISGMLGENLTDEDLKQMTIYLDRFNLSGLYGIDETNRIMHTFRIKFILRNIDLLDFLQFNYSHKISGIGDVKPIIKPANSTPVEEMDLPFLSQPMTDEEFIIPESDDSNAENELTDAVNMEVGNAPTKGDKNAPVTIIEYSDFECPFCGKFQASTLPQLLTNYINKGKVLFAYKHFPLSFHANSKNASLAAECAKEQGGDEVFFKYHDLLYTNQSSLTIENLKKWAVDLGLDTSKFNYCLDTQKYAKEVDADFAEGESYGVSGTPAFFINGRMISGAQPYSEFKKIIDEELAK